MFFFVCSTFTNPLYSSSFFFSLLSPPLDLHRAEGLRTLTIWAPNLVLLNVQACCEIENIIFSPGHRLQNNTNLVYPNWCKDKLEVCALYSLLGPKAKKQLFGHDRAIPSRKTLTHMPTEGEVKKVGDADDSDYLDYDWDKKRTNPLYTFD